jgi:hypothetical protein
MIEGSGIDPGTAGAAALMFGVVLGLFEFLKRIWPGQKLSSEKIVVDCPNKIHSLNQTIERLEAEVALIEKRSGPIDGVEQWKRSQMQDALLQQIIDKTSESVTLQQKSLRVLEKIASRPPAGEKKGDDDAKGKRSRFIDEPSPG